MKNIKEKMELRERLKHFRNYYKIFSFLAILNLAFLIHTFLDEGFVEYRELVRIGSYVAIVIIINRAMYLTEIILGDDNE